MKTPIREAPDFYYKTCLLDSASCGQMTLADYIARSVQSLNDAFLSQNPHATHGINAVALGGDRVRFMVYRRSAVELPPLRRLGPIARLTRRLRRTKEPSP